MSKSKKIFVAFAIVFVLIMLYIAYDISQRTTAPWNKHHNETKDRTEKSK